MKRLLPRTFLAFTAALFLLIAVLTVVFLMGYRKSLSDWSASKRDSLEVFVVGFLLATPGFDAASAPQEFPLFIYDRAKKLVFTNRGMGRRQSGNVELIPVSHDGRLVGYYRSGSVHFQNDRSNERFISSMGQTVLIGLVIALFISLICAFLFSRNLSSPAESVAAGLRRIARGDLSDTIPVRGAEEIAGIARSANELADQLARERQMRRQWIGDIAHDLRTPITAMRAQFEAMSDGVLEATPERVGRSLQEVTRLEALVSDLEELMRLESPEIRTEPQLIDLHSFFEELKGRFSVPLMENRITFTTDIRVDRLRVDRNLLFRAVSNVVSNSVRHTPVEGSVSASARQHENGVVITIRNTGEPIPADEIERVFDRLYRGEYARKSAGSGLGLTITKRIIELHEGTVRIHNEEDGVSVSLVLPNKGLLPRSL